MAGTSLWDQFQTMRDQNQAAVTAADRPNIATGIRPSQQEIYSSAPMANLKAAGQGIADAAQGFIDNRREAIGKRPSLVAPKSVATPPATPARTDYPAGSLADTGTTLQPKPRDSVPEQAETPAPAAPAGTLLQSKPRDPTAEQAKNLSFMGQKIGQGYTPIAPEDTTLVRTQNGVTDYQTPKGSITMPENGVLGVPSRQGGGTLSVLSGRTPEEQALIDARVDSLNRQTEALRQYNIDTGRSYAPGSSLAVPTAEPVDLFARPGDRFGDSQMRQAQFEGLLKEAASGRNVGGGRRGRARDAEQRKAMIDAAQGLLAPGLGAAEMQGRQQASRDSLLGQLAQVGATQSATQQRRQASREQLALDQHKANQEQQIKGGELTLNALKTYQGMGEAQQQQAKADLYQAYADAVNQGDQAMISKLQPLMDYLYPQKQQNDALATLLQQIQK